MERRYRRSKLPRISILLPVQNESKYIEGCLRSIQDQTYSDWELVLVDDASTDDTVKKIEPFLEDTRIKFIPLKESMVGPSYAWANINQFMHERSTGELLANFGGDDLMMPDRLEQQAKAFDDIPDLDIHHSAARHISPSNQVMSSTYEALPYHRENILRLLFAWNWIAFPTTMIKRTAFEKIGPYRAGVGSVHDYDFWLRSAGRLRYCYSPDYLNYIRVGDNTCAHPEGLRHTRDKTYQVRHEARETVMIEELFPEIARCQDKTRATAASYVAMGDLWMACNCPDPQMALKEYQSANAILEDHPVICLNAAIATLSLGQNDAAMTTLEALDRSDPLVNRSLLIARGVLNGRHQLASGRSISPELYEVAKKLPARTWRSDGTIT
jgi:hypothetical protein